MYRPMHALIVDERIPSDLNLGSELDCIHLSELPELLRVVPEWVYLRNVREGYTLFTNLMKGPFRFTEEDGLLVLNGRDVDTGRSTQLRVVRRDLARGVVEYRFVGDEWHPLQDGVMRIYVSFLPAT